MAAEKLCDIDREWECSSTVKWVRNSNATPLLRNLERKEEKIKTANVTLFLDVF
jgi:hypothetical protein